MYSRCRTLHARVNTTARERPCNSREQRTRTTIQVTTWWLQQKKWSRGVKKKILQVCWTFQKLEKQLIMMICKELKKMHFYFSNYLTKNIWTSSLSAKWWKTANAVQWLNFFQIITLHGNKQHCFQKFLYHTIIPQILFLKEGTEDQRGILASNRNDYQDKISKIKEIGKN